MRCGLSCPRPRWQTWQSSLRASWPEGYQSEGLVELSVIEVWDKHPTPSALFLLKQIHEQRAIGYGTSVGF